MRNEDVDCAARIYERKATNDKSRILFVPICTTWQLFAETHSYRERGGRGGHEALRLCGLPGAREKEGGAQDAMPVLLPGVNKVGAVAFGSSFCLLLL